jgi:hypothetical protein
MSSFGEMPVSVYEFYYRLCQYYDDPKLRGTFGVDELIKIPVPEKYQSRLMYTVEAARTLSMSYQEHDNVLLSYDSRELRMALLYRLGYYPAEIDGIFGFRARYFRRDGTGRLGPLSIDDACRVGPLLEVDPLLLLDQSRTNYAPVDRTPWFQSHLVPEISFNDLVQSSVPKGDYVSARMWIDQVDMFVGVVLIQLQDFAEISFTVEQPTSVMYAQWDMRLFAFAKSIGVNGPAVYTVSALFLDRSQMRIHRLSFPRTAFPLTRFRVYTRVFSPRTEEAIFYKEGKSVAYKFPQARAVRTAINGAVYGLWEPLITDRPEEAVHCPWRQDQVEENA